MKTSEKLKKHIKIITILIIILTVIVLNCSYIRCDDYNKESEIMDNYWQELAI